MFNYKSYEDASKMKSRISAVIFQAHDSVVSVATEQEKCNNSAIYSVKIGLRDALGNGDECDKILTTLMNAKIISESPDKISFIQKQSLFKHVGVISAQNSSANLHFLYSGFAFASVVGAVGLAACAYKMTR